MSVNKDLQKYFFQMRYKSNKVLYLNLDDTLLMIFDHTSKNIGTI